MRRAWWRAGLASLAVGACAPASAIPAPEPEVVVDGRGWGHGVGLPQDGALAMGRAGATTEEILATFYPGTSLGRRGGRVRVEVLDRPVPSAIVSFPGGGELRDALSGDQAPGFPVTVVPGGSVELRWSGGRYRAIPRAGATAAPLPDAPPDPPAEPAEPPSSARALGAVPAERARVALPAAGRRYRGLLEAVVDGGQLRLLNHLDVEEYLAGMGEVLDPAWPDAGLQAQAVAARTYALDAMAKGQALCSTEQCQVYLGQSAEYPAMTRAVAATRGQVLVHGGALAEAVYSASAGGTTATPAEGFGTPDGDHPYLSPVPYDAGDLQPWSARLPLADVARRLGYPGTATGAAVSRNGPSGRALEVTVDGDAGPLAVTGIRFYSTLRLKSTLYSVRVEAPAPAAGDTPTASVLSSGAEAQVTPPPGPEPVRPTGPPARGRAPWVATATLALATWAAAAQAALARAGPARGAHVREGKDGRGDPPPSPQRGGPDGEPEPVRSRYRRRRFRRPGGGPAAGPAEERDAGRPGGDPAYP